MPARISEENKGWYRVLSEPGEFLARITGKIRFHAETKSDFPATGDWVLIRPRPLEGRATIETILPRRTILSRKGAGKTFEEQVLAANVETIFVVTSLNQELNLRRLERYLSAAWESGAEPVILLSKADLCPDSGAIQAVVAQIAPAVPIHVVSAVSGEGMEKTKHYLSEGKTVALIGSSGVGKSTIINALAGHPLQRIQEVRVQDDRGRHTTNSRQMFLLPGGGIVIDTPGMRELHLWQSDEGMTQAFQDLDDFARLCKFRNCRHQGEPGCAVAAAVKTRILAEERLSNYRKLQAELKFVESKTNWNERQAAKMRAKRMCKAQKQFYRNRGPEN